MNNENNNRFIMEPIKNGYKVFYKKEHIANISFINKNDNIDRDMETAQDNPNNYDVVVTEVKSVSDIKRYIRKIKKCGFKNIVID